VVGGAVVDGATTAACVIGTGADGDVAGGAGRVSAGCVCCAAAAACVAWWLGALVAVGEVVVVRPAGVPLPGAAGGSPECVAAMMTISATKARIPVSALLRVSQDQPRCGGRDGGCGARYRGGDGGPKPRCPGCDGRVGGKWG
jgi:hypothetical protein